MENNLLEDMSLSTNKISTVQAQDVQEIKDSKQSNIINSNNTNTENLNKETSCFNPSVSDDLQDDLKKMKGDAIGNTLYSERFVLSTLLKLTKIERQLDDDEDFEKDLCNLWDMTIEEDVVKLLLEHKCLELFSGIIQQTEDKRLTEILVGIIGNMCSLRETRDELCINPNITSPIIDLISCTDTLTLIQLMRLFCATLVFENSGDELYWFQHFKNSENFVENFAFILINSMNSALLFNAIEALNAICAKFAVIELQPNTDDLCFCDFFVKPQLIIGVNEAFKTLTAKTANISSNGSEDLNRKSRVNTTCNSGTNCDTLTENLQKIMNSFLDIHVLLSQYGQLSRKCYEPLLSDLMKCIYQILSPLCQPICLLPLSYNEQGVIENINELSQALGDPFDEVCFAQMVTIWSLIDVELKQTLTSNDSEFNDGFDDNVDSLRHNTGSELNKDVCMTTLEYITRVARNATEKQLKDSLHFHSTETIMRLLDVLAAENSEPNMNEIYTKIKLAFCVTHPEDNLTNYENCEIQQQIK